MKGKITKKSCQVLIIIVICALSGACYPRRVGILEGQVSKMQQTQDDLGKKNMALAEQIEQLHKEASELSDQVAQLNKKWEFLSSAIDSGRRSEPGKASPGAPPRTSISLPEEFSPVQLLERAKQNLVAGKYNRTIIDLEELLALYGKSPQAENARFLIGESYYAQGDYTRAFEAFSTFMTAYQNSTQFPAAALKCAYACDALGWKDKAKVIYEELVKNYKDTSESEAAEKKLSQLISGPPEK